MYQPGLGDPKCAKFGVRWGATRAGVVSFHDRTSDPDPEAKRVRFHLRGREDRHGAHRPFSAASGCVARKRQLT